VERQPRRGVAGLAPGRCLGGGLRRIGRFYGAYRWTGWEAEVAALGPDEALSIYPPLGFEATPITERSRRPVPARELWMFNHETARAAGEVAPDAQINLKAADQ
jgi:hypothetical protein